MEKINGVRVWDKFLVGGSKCNVLIDIDSDFLLWIIFIFDVFFIV